MFTTLKFWSRNLATSNLRQIPRTLETTVRYISHSPNTTLRFNKKLQGSILSATQCDRVKYVANRCYSDSDRGTFDENQPRRYPKFSDDPIRISVSLAEYLWSLYAAARIRMLYDSDYSPKEFRDGSSQAIEVVFRKLTTCQFDDLKDLLDNDLVLKLEDYFKKLSENQRFDFRFCQKQIINALMRHTRIIEEGDRVFVEVSTAHIVMFDSEDDNTYEEKPLAINCRFIKEFTKGIDDEWTIDEMNFEMAEAGMDTIDWM